MPPPLPLPEKLSLLRSLMWDYSSIPPEHCLEVLEGTRERAGHYTESSLFRKLIESYPFYTVLKILPKERILALLTDENLKLLRFKSLSKRYAFIRSRLQNNLFPIDPALAVWSERFVRLWVGKESRLKLEFVNDVGFRWGENLFAGKIALDNPANILANKLTAVVTREEPKDVFDIVTLSQTYSFDWQEVFRMAFEKQLMDASDAAMRLSTFPVEWMRGLSWLMQPVNEPDLKKDLDTLADDLLFGRMNSLGAGKTPLTEGKAKE